MSKKSTIDTGHFPNTEYKTLVKIILSKIDIDRIWWVYRF